MHSFFVQIYNWDWTQLLSEDGNRSQAVAAVLHDCLLEFSGMDRGVKDFGVIPFELYMVTALYFWHDKCYDMCISHDLSLSLSLNISVSFSRLSRLYLSTLICEYPGICLPNSAPCRNIFHTRPERGFPTYLQLHISDEVSKFESQKQWATKMDCVSKHREFLLCQEKTGKRQRAHGAHAKQEPFDEFRRRFLQAETMDLSGPKVGMILRRRSMNQTKV